MLISHRIRISEETQVGEARRLIRHFCDEHGFDPALCDRAALVVSEIARNLVLHTDSGGEIVWRRVREFSDDAIEILSLDQGPGMANLGECLRDGFSTAGTAGNGMGAIGRLSDLFEINSVPELGTALLVQLRSKVHVPPVSDAGFLSGGVCLPVLGEEFCGDHWAACEESGLCRVMVADGLGHGPFASEASVEALRVFKEAGGDSPLGTLARIHAALKKTRGAAVAVAHLDPRSNSIRYGGIGNISATLVSPDSQKSFVSSNGTAGAVVHKQQEFVYDWPQEAILVMHSDGLSTHWRLDRYPGLAQRHPSLIAGVLYRDYQRVRDDATVVVIRRGKSRAMEG